MQTSNYAPEFGQAGGGLFNITMKSGTNQYHGSGYEYFVNEDLNAAVPFTNNGSGDKIRPRNRRNDFGGTVGGTALSGFPQDLQRAQPDLLLLSAMKCSAKLLP